MVRAEEERERERREERLVRSESLNGLRTLRRVSCQTRISLFCGSSRWAVRAPSSFSTNEIYYHGELAPNRSGFSGPDLLACSVLDSTVVQCVEA